MFSEALSLAIDRAVPQGTTHVGFIGREVAGRHAFAVTGDEASLSLPAVEVAPGERPSEALTRCVRDHLGIVPRAVYPLTGPWRAEGRSSMFFAGLSAVAGGAPSGRAAPVTPLRWCERDEAHALLAASPRESERRRDLYLLSQVTATALSIERRLLLTMQGLHRMGFERLRCRLERSRADRSFRFGLVLPPDASPVAGAALKETLAPPMHGGAQGQFPFGWGDACFDAPDALAAKMLARAPDLLYAGWGVDRDYVRWFDEALATTAPEGLFVTGAEGAAPTAVQVERHVAPPPIAPPPPWQSA